MLLRVVLLLVLAVPVAPSLTAEQFDSPLITVIPPGPTSADRIVIRASVWCNPVGATVTVVDRVIEVDFQWQGMCGSPPFLDPYTAEVPGILEAGEYVIEVPDGSGGTLRETLVVREAAPRPYEVHPSTPTTQGGVELRLVDANGTVVASQTAPELPIGLHDVQIGEIEVENAVYAWDKSVAPNASVFERILIPVLFDAPGANGSEWRSELTIVNTRPWFIQPYNFSRIAPNQVQRITDKKYPQGVAFMAPREETGDLAFSLRIRDVSRVAEGFGTNIPVVRERDMYTNVLVPLPDVPLDPRYRVKVRVYAFDAYASNLVPGASLTLVDAFGARTHLHKELTESCHTAACHAITPLFAEFDLAPGREGERVDLYVQSVPDARVWAFATVTNNDTQQVTIVTPDGSGGPPCALDGTCEGGL